MLVIRSDQESHDEVRVGAESFYQRLIQSSSRDANESIRCGGRARTRARFLEAVAEYGDEYPLVGAVRMTHERDAGWIASVVGGRAPGEANSAREVALLHTGQLTVAIVRVEDDESIEREDARLSR